MSATNILQAVDIVTTSKIQKLKFDKTIVATIKHVLDIDVGEYRAEYEAGTFKVYAEDPNIVYTIGQSVYVKIPEGDYSNKKFIEGLVANEEVAKKALDLSQIKIYASQKFNLDRNGKQWKNVSDKFKQYIKLYSAKENGFIKLTAKFSGQSNTTENYGLKGNGVWALSVLDMNGTPFNKPNGAYDSAYLKELNEYKDGLVLNFVDGNKSFVCEEVYVEFGEMVDFSTTPYYLIINVPNGIDGNDIVLEGRLYGEGKDITDTISIFQWYEEITGETDIDAGFGWKKFEGEVTSVLKVATAGQKQYKLIAFYEENKSVSQTITVNPATGFIIAGEDGSVTHSENKELVIVDYYNPNGKKLDKFNNNYPYLTIKAKDEFGNIYTTIWKQPDYSRSIGFIGHDLFHYNANSDISAAIVNQEYTIEFQFLQDVEIYKIEWESVEDNETYIIGQKYNPQNSMIKELWVDNNNILHYIIKDTYSIQNYNNTFRIKITDINQKTYSSLKEIYFIKDGQQGTNGTEYCCIVRPVAADGVTLLSEAEAILGLDDSICLKAFVYKNSKLIDDECSYSWYEQSDCLEVENKKNNVCIVNHKANSVVVSNLHIVSLQLTVDSGYIYFNYPLTFFNGNPSSIIELSYPKYVEYTASGVSPEWLDKPIVCKSTDSNNWVFGSNNNELLTINKNKIIPSPTFDFSNGIGVLKSGNLYCPVMMYLNTFGNEAINGWDGTSLQLDNNKGTILAPQIGAGEKNLQTNQFTGVIMGKDSSIPNNINFSNTGLFGYKEGVNSFGLMSNGKAYFGTNDDNRIWFDGESATIKGGGGGDSNKGMTINLSNSDEDKTATAIKISGGKFQVLYDGTMTATAGTIGGWNIQGNQTNENNEVIPGKLFGGQTVLDSKNGITTNALAIKENTTLYGTIGKVRTSESGAALGIQSDSQPIVFETNDNIRISGPGSLANPKTFIHANYIEIGKTEHKPSIKLSGTILINGQTIEGIIKSYLENNQDWLNKLIDHPESSGGIVSP